MKTLFTMIISLFATLSFARVYDFTEGNKIELIENPKDSIAMKLDLVKKAKHHIHIITYYLDSTSFSKELAKELKNAHERGVEVRVLTTLYPTLITDIFQKTKRQLTSDDETSVHPLAFLYLNVNLKESLASNLHEKLFLVDSEKAIIGGRNISDHSIDGKDLEVLLEGPIVNQAQAHFKTVLDFLIEQNRNSKCKNTNIECIDKFNSYAMNDDKSLYFKEQPIFANGTKARLLSHEAVLKQYQNHYSISERLNMPDDILDTVRNVNFNTLRFYNYFVIPTKRFSDYLEENLSKGKEIKMITNSLESATFSSNKGYFLGLPTMKKLIDQNAKIYQWNKDETYTYVHEKVLIFDNDHIFLGSHNLGIGSTAVSNEIAVEIFSKEIGDRLIQVFDDEISNSSRTFPASDYSLESEEKNNHKMIRVLNLKPIKDIINELY